MASRRCANLLSILLVSRSVSTVLVAEAMSVVSCWSHASYSRGASGGGRSTRILRKRSQSVNLKALVGLPATGTWVAMMWWSLISDSSMLVHVALTAFLTRDRSGVVSLAQELAILVGKAGLVSRVSSVSSKVWYNSLPLRLEPGYPHAVCCSLKSPTTTSGYCTATLTSFLISVFLIRLIGFFGRSPSGWVGHAGVD